MESSLMSDFIIKQQEIQTQLQNRIFELEEELNVIKNKGDYVNDIILCKDILNLIIPNLKFTYDDSENGFYKIHIDPPISMSKLIIDHILKEIEKWKENENNEY